VRVERGEEALVVLKAAVITDLTERLTSSKMTVVAQYKGMTVKSMQTLRKEAFGKVGNNSGFLFFA
jgi:ribosomal protein L10